MFLRYVYAQCILYYLHQGQVTYIMLRDELGKTFGPDFSKKDHPSMVG